MTPTTKRELRETVEAAQRERGSEWGCQDLADTLTALARSAEQIHCDWNTGKALRALADVLEEVAR